MHQGKAFTASLGLLEAFAPSAWSEKLYIKTPPFVSENIDGTILLIPFGMETEHILDSMSSSLGLKKRKDGGLCYFTSRSDTIKALRMFDWFVRRSWHNKELAVVWALLHAAGAIDKARPVVALQSVVDLTGLEPKVCAETVRQLLQLKGETAKTGWMSDYEVDKERLCLALERFFARTPTWTEELIMNALCSGMGASIVDVYRQMMLHDLSVGAVYKTAEKLKRGGFVQTMKHFRVNERGPMRELLSSDCRNCFYGYSNAEKCFEDALRRLEDQLRRYYHKELTEEQRVNSHNSIRSVPFSPKVIRKVLEALRLMHHMESVLREKQVLGMLKKLEEWYGIELPINPETFAA